MNNIQVYVTEYHAEAQHEVVLLTLNGVDKDLLLGELSTEDKLDSVDFAELVDYVQRQQEE